MKKGTKPVKGKRVAQYTYAVGKPVRPDNNPFTRWSRMPGWLPDADDLTFDGHDFVFPEETFKYTVDSNGKPKDGPFKLPDPVNPGTRWVLGDPIPAEPASSDPKVKPFVRLIRALALKIRVYNATLHQLRRFHYYQKLKVKLPANPQGDQRELPAPGDPDFGDRAQEAEENWASAAAALNNLIDPDPSAPPFGLVLVAADMVQVNNYIVSMRIVAKSSFSLKGAIKPKGAGKYHPNQIGGSESSHVSIDLVFSSSST